MDVPEPNLGDEFDPPPEIGQVRYTRIEEAARDLLARQVMSPLQYQQLRSSARQAAFTVSRQQTEETIDKIRDVIHETTLDGASLRQFRDRLEAELGESPMGDWHTEVVFRTNIQQSIAEGQDFVQGRRLIADELPYVAYFAIRDDRVRDDHLWFETGGLSGTNVYRRTDPVIRKFRPPWSWNCRCQLIAYTIEQAARAGVAEAIEWQKTGIEPFPAAKVAHPPFDLHPSWNKEQVGMEKLAKRRKRS